MAEAGTPQPDGARPPTPRSRGDRGRDPAALAAWRRVAEQRRRAVDGTTSPADRFTEPPVVEPPVVEPPVVEPPVVEPPVVEAPVVDAPVVEAPALDASTDDHPVVEATTDDHPVVEASTDDHPVVGDPVVGDPVVERPAVAWPAGDRPAATRPATVRPVVRPAADRPAAARPAADRPVVRPAADRPAATRPAVDHPVDDRPAAARPSVARPVADRPVVATPARTGVPADVPVRAVRDDRATGRPTRPEARPAPPTTRGEPAPAPTRTGTGDGPPPATRLHDVLLGLAGRLDDDALTSVREMVAAEDDAQAAELLGGCLLAGGIGLTGEERATLRPWFTAARVDPELLGLLPSDSGALDRSVHRFVTSAADRAPGAPLARAAGRLSGVVAVRESWRITPAGSAPGPLPHRVVLVETVGPDDCDHVVHHLAHAARALDDTSVEVFATGAGLPAYHRDALAAARPLVADDAMGQAPPAAAAPPVAAPPAPVASPAPATVAPPAPPVRRFGAAEDEETWRTVADAGSSRTGPSPVAAQAAGGDVDDVDTDAPDDDEPELVDLDEPELADLDEPELADLDEPELADLDEPEPEPRTPERPAPPRPERPAPARPVHPASSDGPPRTAANASPPETSIDEDLSSTARRIAALWARPSPEDFSAPLPADDSLEPTRLEPAGGDVADAPTEPGRGPEDDAPSGRHGRPTVADMGTTSFRSPRTRSRTNGRPVARSGDPSTGRAATRAADPTPTSPPASTGEAPPDPDSGQLPRTRHRRANDPEMPQEPDAGPARFGHDARFGAGPGPAWPGGPVPGDPRPGQDTLFTSPVEVGEEPVDFGTNGHRHGPDPAVSDDEPDTLGTNGHRHDPVAVDDEPPTGPVAWSGPAGPTAVASPPGPRVVGPPPAAGPAVVPPPPAGPPAWAPEPDNAAPWPPDDDSVAQLSDRERELLARLHEELAQRERSEGADPFAPPRTASERPQSPGPRSPRPGSPGGRVNGHGLPPGGPDDAGA
jgi:hypothetical protein